MFFKAMRAQDSEQQQHSSQQGGEVPSPAHPPPPRGVPALGGPSDTIGCELGCLGLNPEFPVSSLTWTTYSTSPGLSFYI